MSQNLDFQLARDAHGRLTLTDKDGQQHTGVVPVRAFPIAQPERGIGLMSVDGHELAWIEQLTELPAAIRQLLEEELASREFMPEIRTIKNVSTFATPSTWTVDTDRGAASFVLKGEEDIRRVGGGTLMIADSHGIHFLIRDSSRLDSHSRRILDRFL